MRKTIFKTTAVLCASLFILYSCRKDAKTDSASGTISQDALDKIYNLGFSNKNVFLNEDGNYVVEGDIILTEKDLNATMPMQFLRVGTAEQYRTTNLVTGLPRTITVSMSSRLPSSFIPALDAAIKRYNDQKLQISFQRVSSGGAIDFVKASGSYLASSGFPSSTGDPYYQVKVNARAIDGQPLGTIASIFAHEMGHCIGFRHTDYMDRSYSCGGAAVNEGASTVGAIYIPGTAVGPDPNSWMLSCIGSGQDRPFNSNDVTALKYLY